MLPKLTLILGGASSGKTRYAESLCLSEPYPRTYLASGQAFDDEMRQKILAHQSDRGTDWATIEAPLQVAEALKTAKPHQVWLFDCATMWLSNHLLAHHDLAGQQRALLNALETCAAHVVVVSNEVGQGIVPETQLGRQFRVAQGQLNQALAAQADRVVFIAAGLPLTLKG